MVTMAGPPGVPMKSGLRTPSDEEQEQWRAEHRKMQRRLAPFIEDVERCRREAWSASITAVVG